MGRVRKNEPFADFQGLIERKLRFEPSFVPEKGFFRLRTLFIRSRLSITLSKGATKR